jgi:prolipoprotein diacylglyceryltransferase
MIANMFPVLLTLGPITLRTYTVLMDAGIALALLALYRAAPEGKRTIWLDAGITTTIGGFIGARLLYAMANGSYYAAHPEEVFQVWLGGLSWSGAALGAGLGLWLYCSRKRKRGEAYEREAAWPIVEALAFPIALLGLLGWGGCWAASCAYGYEVAPGELPAWMVSNAPDLYGLTLPRWPTQAAGLLWSIFVIGAVWGAGAGARNNQWPVGAHGLYALSLVALGLFLLNFTRGDPSPLINSIRIDVIGSAIVLLLTTLLWVTRLNHKPAQSSNSPILQ